MSLAGEMDPTTMEPFPPDPLLKAGAFIDPHPVSNGNFVPEPEPEPVSTPGPTEHQTPADKTPGSELPQPDGSQFDWLPPGWTVLERVRASGASAGARDKYYVEPATKRRFRSRKEVLAHLGIKETPLKRKMKNPPSYAAADVVATPQANTKTAQKRGRKKKSEMTAKDLVNRFNFDDVPDKVKWELIDVYKASWQPLLNSSDKVSETCRQEWAATFSYISLPNEEKETNLF